MESIAVRCPKCRKKQTEPSPERCGCGQSLLALLAARRVEASPQLAEGSGEAWGTSGDQKPRPALADNGQPHHGPPRTQVDNEW